MPQAPKTPNTLSTFFRPFSRAGIFDAEHLHKAVPDAQVKTGPVLGIEVDVPMQQATTRFGVRALGECDMLFFDVYTDKKYFCNVASAGDPTVIAATRQWGLANAIPVWMQQPDGSGMFVLQPFSLEPAYEKAFSSSSHDKYLETLLTIFTMMRGPGGVEAVVAAQKGREFEQVQIGFLATAHAQPLLSFA